MSGSDNRNAVLFYFSGTGNTWWVSEELAGKLKEKGFQCQVYSIEAVRSEAVADLINDSCLVGFGYPIHGSDLPQLMKDFIATLPQTAGKKAFTYCTQWLWSGDGAAIGASMLEEKGFLVQWGEHILMPNNISVSIVRLPYTNDPKRLAVIRKRASKRIERFADSIAKGKSYKRGFNYLAYLLGSMQRVPYRHYYSRLQDDIAVNKETCINCGDCVRFCPVGNLYYLHDSIETKGTCILCNRCYDFCPVAAITYMKREHRPERGEPYRGPIEDFDPSVLISPSK